MMYLFFLVCLLITHRIDGDNNKVLNEFINYYEPVVYAVLERENVGSPWIPISVTNSDEKRGTITTNAGKAHSSLERVEIRAFGRVFQLELRRTVKILAADADILIMKGLGDCTTEKMNAKAILSNLVEGKVTNEPKSYVHGALRNGVFTGIIYLDNQTLFVERASKYFKDKVPFDCVIFRQEDLNMTAFDCGMGPDGYKCDPIRLLQRTGPTTEQVMPVIDGLDVIPEHSWFGRNTPKTTCNLKIVADHLFYQHAGESSPENAIYEMIFHVHEADRIFRATDFDEDGRADNIGFKIEAVEVYTSTACYENPAFTKQSITSDQYLEIFSERDFHNYCVGVAFSGYTFPGRVLGIAWMADADNSGYVGGICEPRLYSTQDQKALSFNSAVITMMLEGRRMPRGITAIAVAHELGHSFGSDHDPYQDPVCSPSRDNGGKFIMAAFAVKGDQPNNRYFSPCSKHNMKTVLKKKGTCFTSQASLACSKIDGTKRCVSDLIQEHGNSVTLEVGTETAPNSKKIPQGNKCPCPPGKCTYSPNVDIPTSEDVQACHITDSDCIAPEALCETAGWCPSPNPKMPDGSICSDGSGECWDGSCVINQCTLIGQLSCECSELDNACIVCCKDTDNDEDCKPIQRKDTPWWLLRRPGESCQQGMGECDKYGRCGLRPLDLLPVNKSSHKEMEDTRKVVNPDDIPSVDFDDIPENWDWLSYDDDEVDEYGLGYSPVSKMGWWQKIFVQLMWICLGIVMFLTLVLCVCFICPAIAVGIWCLRQCTCVPDPSGENTFLLTREAESIIPTGIFYQSNENENIDLPSRSHCPIPDIQTRSRTF